MDKNRLVAEGAVQQSKDEATIQVFYFISIIINQNLLVLCSFSIIVEFVHFIWFKN